MLSPKLQKTSARGPTALKGVHVLLAANLTQRKAHLFFRVRLPDCQDQTRCMGTWFCSSVALSSKICIVSPRDISVRSYMPANCAGRWSADRAESHLIMSLPSPPVPPLLLRTRRSGAGPSRSTLLQERREIARQPVGGDQQLELGQVPEDLQHSSEVQRKEREYPSIFPLSLISSLDFSLDLDYLLSSLANPPPVLGALDSDGGKGGSRLQGLLLLLSRAGFPASTHRPPSKDPRGGGRVSG